MTFRDCVNFYLRFQKDILNRVDGDGRGCIPPPHGVLGVRFPEVRNILLGHSFTRKTRLKRKEIDKDTHVIDIIKFVFQSHTHTRENRRQVVMGKR